MLITQNQVFLIAFLPGFVAIPVMLESAYILEVLTLSNICSYRWTVGL